MHAFSTNYLERKGGRRAGTVLDRGFWIHGLPRVILLCRLFGHRPVVDGIDPAPGANPRYSRANRWVCCDRCGVRPDPQGSLDPDVWSIGQRYTGRPKGSVLSEPGPWPQRPTGTVGGQLVIGRTFSTGVEIKVGNPGSEQVLAGHISASRLGALYLHTEAFGTWLQRRLNPHRYESRVTGFSIHSGHLYWRIWAPRDHSSRDDPWWQHGSFRIDPRDILLGPKRHSYDDVTAPVTAKLRMPHGDDHEVQLRLQRQTLARARPGWLLRFLPRPRQITSYHVDVHANPGIPTKPGGHGRVGGFGVDIPDAAADSDWIAAALAEAAKSMTRDRARYDYRPAAVADA